MRRIVLLFSFIAALAPAPTRADEGNWKSRMLTELPKAWESVRAVCANLEGTLNEHVQDPSPRHKQTEHKSTRFVIRGDRVLYKAVRKDEPGEEVVVGVNENYAFGLSARGSKIAVSFLTQRGSQEDARLTDQVDGDVYGAVWSPWTSRCIPLAEWLTKPGFSILAVKPQQVGPKRLVRLEYTYQDPKPKDARLPPERSRWEGYHLLDPDNSWVIHESFIKAWYGTDTLKIQHKDRIGGFPVGHRTVIENRAPNGERVSDFVWATADLKPSQATYDDFTLSAFGLPEPTFAPRRGGRWPIYLGLAAGFALLAVGLRWWAKRRRASLG